MTMSGSNDFEKRLAQDMGYVKGKVEGFLETMKRALDNQEEAFKRLNQAEVKLGKVEEKVKGVKVSSGKISGLISFIVAVAANFLKILLWKDS